MEYLSFMTNIRFEFNSNLLFHYHYLLFSQPCKTHTPVLLSIIIQLYHFPKILALFISVLMLHSLMALAVVLMTLRGGRI